MSTAALTPAKASAPLEKSDITKKQLKVVHDTIASQLNDSDVRKGIRGEVKKMGESVVAMETDFAKVYAFVKNLDDLGVVLNKDGQVIKLAPEWKILHDEYTGLMNKSQETATLLNVKIQELLDVFLPYVESKASTGKKETKLSQYIADLETFVAGGTTNANRFLRLRENVVAYQKKLHDIIPSQITDVKTQLAKLDGDIKKIEGELKIITNFLEQSWYKAGATDGLSGIVNLAPQATLPILGQILSFFGESTITDTLAKGAEKEKKENEIKELRKQQGVLNARRGHLEAALTALNALDATFADLIGRLATVEGVWRMLVNDAIKLKEGLVKVDQESAPKDGKAQPVDDEDEAIFLALRMKSLKVVYFTLQDALDTYALSVAPQK